MAEEVAAATKAEGALVKQTADTRPENAAVSAHAVRLLAV